jgi:hypothetical protein
LAGAAAAAGAAVSAQAIPDKSAVLKHAAATTGKNARFIQPP